MSILPDLAQKIFTTTKKTVYLITMDHKTVQSLNEINAQFYASIGKYFDETRQQYWQGWDQVLDHTFPTPRPLSVLDIGCGNGRFSSFLANKGYEIAYTGIDLSLIHI